jgi:hypothetical protein
MTICQAKCEWVDSLVDNPEISIWDLAKWPKGRRLKEIPPDPDLQGTFAQSQPNVCYLPLSVLPV